MISPIININTPFNLGRIEKQNIGKLYLREHTDSAGICHVKIASTNHPFLYAIKHFIVELFSKKYHYTHGHAALTKIYERKWHLNAAQLETSKKAASVSPLHKNTSKKPDAVAPKQAATPSHSIGHDKVQHKPQVAPSPKTVIVQKPILKDPLIGKSSFEPPFEISNARPDVDTLMRLQTAVDKYNQHSKTKINLKKDADGKLFLCHTRFEMNSLIRNCPELRPFFTNKFGKSCFGSKSTAYVSAEGLSFYENSSGEGLYKSLKDQYSKASIQKQPKVDLPKLNHFSGSKQEISQVFKSMLSNSKGIIIGEVHTDKSPKRVLKEQMENLHKEGVKTLFLEHCCYDTLQPELEEFYRTKTASPFLKDFLTNGCGGAVGDVNYYPMVEAAVKAGIRPVGIELSSTQLIGFEDIGGAHGEKRYIGMNIPAKEIIEREAGDGKYIALVGSAHVSYCEDVAGLSELCGASSMVISDKKKKANKPSYHTNQKFLGFNMSKPHNAEMFNNKKEVHFTQAHLHL